MNGSRAGEWLDSLPTGSRHMVLDVNETTTCLTLDEQGSTDIALVGAKAANLARARAGGLPALPGAVLTTNWSPSDAEAAWAVYDEISRGGRSPVVVRSSSTGEDGEVSSMAGVFESVLDVTRGSFLRAVATVLSSSSRASTHDLVSAPMAVLVQPMLRPRWGGVLFSADPVTGRRDRFLVAAVPGAPDALVSGEVDGWTAVLDPRGRIREVRSAGEPDDRPPADQLRELARLAKRAEALYGRPQDLEWAIDDDLGLVLLQARPITTISDPRSPVFGPGPVAESFPEPLCRLEEDLWLEPLRRGLREALRLSGTCVPRDLETSELVIAVDGAPAVHLSCIGADEPGRATVLQRLDPRPPARRLRAAWRVGRLRAAIGQLSADVSLVVDSHLTSVEEIASLSDDQLLAVMFRSRDLLVSLHGYEVLAGLLIPDTATSSVTASSLALAAVAQGRAAGRTAREVIARDPVVLALVPPRVGPSRVEDFLERLAVPPALLPEPAEVDESALRREELKIRIRWVQELQARAAWELGTRLAAAGAIPLANQVRGLRLDELREAVQIRRLPGDLAERSEPADRVLPPRFRLSPEGRAVAVADAVTRRGRASHRDGIGAGGGVGCGVAHHSAEHAPLGAVLVVAHLDPRLAPVVPRLGGLIAETGSTLSHLAILAREYGVPVVVGCASARDRFVPGTNVLIDGHAGTVEILERHQSTPPLMEVAA